MTHTWQAWEMSLLSGEVADRVESIAVAHELSGGYVNEEYAYLEHEDHRIEAEFVPNDDGTGHYAWSEHEYVDGEWQLTRSHPAYDTLDELSEALITWAQQIKAAQ